MYHSIVSILSLILLTGQLLSEAKILQPDPRHAPSKTLSVLPIVVAYAGANGTSEEDLRKLLGNGEDQKHIHEMFTALYKRFAAGIPNATIHLVNYAFADPGLEMHPSYTEFIDEHYKTGLYRVHFNETGTIETINAAVANKTENAISKLVNGLNESTVLALTSAFYFCSKWESKFSPRVPGDFHVTKDKIKKVPMMRKTGRFVYVEQNGFKILSLPFASNTIAMFTLPTKKHNLYSAMEKVDIVAVLRDVVRNGIGEKLVDVKLPVFKLNSAEDLRSELINESFTNIFTPGVANFSGIATLAHPLYVSQTVHKACIEVDEVGVRAGSATSFVFSTASDGEKFLEADEADDVDSVDFDSPAVESTPHQFYADEPFLFSIINKYEIPMYMSDVRMDD